MARAFAPLVLLAALGLLAPAAAHADVKLDVRAEPTTLSLDDRVTLQVTVQAQGLSAPEVSLPDFDGFEIVGQQVQRPMQFSINFGQHSSVKSSTIYTFILQPRREGRIVIKPVRAELDGQVETSQPITIVVKGGAGQPAPGAAPTTPDPDAQPSARPPDTRGMIDSAEIDPIAFLRTVVTKAEPYVGEQVTATMYLYVRERLQSTPSVETEPTTDGLWVHDLMPPARTLQASRQLVNGELYSVYVLRRVAAFPLRSGELTIGPMTITIDTSSLFDIFAPSRARPNLTRSSKAVTMRVKPLPEAGRPQGEIAVGRYTLTAKLDRNQAVTGDAVTLTAIVQGQGNVRDVRLELPSVKGLDVLPPEVKDLVSSPDDLVSGTREYRWLIVPRAPGRYTLPALRLPTFDPQAERYAELTSQPLALEVLGSAIAGTQPGTAPAPDATRADEAGDAEPEHEWAPIRTQSDLTRGYARLSEQAWYGWALAAPGLLWLSFVSGVALRRALGQRVQASAGRGLRQAEQRLEAAERAAEEGDGTAFHAASSAALIAVLEARLGEPVTGYTRAQLAPRLAARGMDEGLARELLAALERCEFARFGSSRGSAAELSARAGEIRSLFRRVAAFTPTVEREENAA